MRTVLHSVNQALRFVPGPAKASKLTMLISSAGRRVALMKAFREAAEALDVELEILVCDLRPEWSSACQLADSAYSVPPATDPSYVTAVYDICMEHGVGLVVPTIDPELAPLSAARARFAACGIEISISDPDVVMIAGDKLATAATLAGCGVPTPRSGTLDAVRNAPQDWTWPMIVKPRHGSAGRGIHCAASAAELPSYEQEPMMAQELLVGEEWTVNIFVSNDGVLRATVPHCRLSVRAGEVEKGVTRRVAIFDTIARQLVACLQGVRGALCFQAMMAADGTVSVFEINARFGGGYPLADHAGATFARWLIEERCGLETTANNNWRSGVRMIRFDDAVFL
jgi:carbamoyl-phosphate synthase large subunit